MTQECWGRDVRALSEGSLITWSTRKLIELTDGRIFDCCEFQLLANPSGFGASGAIHGAMGWELLEGMTIEEYQHHKGELDVFYVEKIPSVIAYQPCSAKELRRHASALEVSFIAMIHQRQANES